ncbi:unannotated protein [freshwater metagenome]|uniref:Unannotated protein n=1 Tax=freshwater metagenome TaxID=449393 RepID=A0A6J7XT67_9ZZZZ|nr:hypothetical protein [Actinomycetota bacterium]
MKKITLPISLLLVISASLFLPSSANAANTGWRYWGYFQAAPGATQWTAAMTGPTVNVKNGSVEGWAFTFSGDVIPDAATPIIAPSFKSICGQTKAVKNKKRIGLVIDFGPKSIRPDGEVAPKTMTRCVVVPINALGIDVLGKVAKIRANASGLICGIRHFPLKECGVEIPTPATL